MSQRRVGVYWHMLPQLNQARKVIWNGRTKDGRSFLDFIPKDLIESTRDDDMLIKMKNGSIIQLCGADHIDSLVGTNPIGINFSEYALMRPSVYDYVSPILNENDGFAVFVTTPRSTNHAFDMFKSMAKAVKEGKPYFVQALTVDDTRKALTDGKGEEILDHDNRKILVPVITSEAIQEQRDLGVPEEIIQQEYYVSFEAGLVGSYYGEAMRKLEEEGKLRQNDSLWVKSDEVITAWDLGISDAMAIWYFQYDAKKKEIRVIESNEFEGRSLAECCCIMRADFNTLRKDFGWSDSEISRATAKYGHHAQYKYAARHFGPHDIVARDVATGVTRKDVAKKYGVKFRAVPKANVLEGINLVRRMLLTCVFDGIKCSGGIRALKDYCKEWDEKRRIYSDKPCHDASSHYSDGFRYMCQGILAFIDNRAAAVSNLQSEADHDYNPFIEKARKADLREMERARNVKKKSKEYYKGMPVFAKTEYDVYRF